MRDLNKLKIGLVLAGGGGKGAYEAGVIAALWDLGLVKNICGVSGTSIGTVNTLLFCMEDRHLIEESWRSLQYSQFITLKEMLGITKIPAVVKSWIEKKGSVVFEGEEDYNTGLISQRGIREFIEKYIDMQKVKDTSIDLYGCAFNVDKQEPTYFHLNDYNGEEVVDICIASCAIPDILNPITIDGEAYVDGGFQSIFELDYKGDNVPIAPLLNHDCDMLLVVHLDYLEKVKPENYPHHAIIEIFPSVPLEIANGFGTLNIFKDTIEKLIDLGYRDTLVSLAPILLAYIRGEEIQPYLKINHDKSANLIETHKPLPIELVNFIHERIMPKKG